MFKKDNDLILFEYLHKCEPHSYCLKNGADFLSGSRSPGLGVFAATEWLIVAFVVIFLHQAKPCSSLIKKSHSRLRPCLLLLRYAAALPPPFTSPPQRPPLMSRPTLPLLSPYYYCCPLPPSHSLTCPHLCVPISFSSSTQLHRPRLLLQHCAVSSVVTASTAASSVAYNVLSF